MKLKTFYFVKMEHGMNQVLNEVEVATQKEAAIIFQSIYKELPLDETGYCRMPEKQMEFSHVSYCVAEKAY